MALVQWSSRGNQLPEFAAEFLKPDKLVPGGAQIDATVLSPPDQQVIENGAAIGAAGNGITMTLAAPLIHPIPINTVLDFGGVAFTLTKQGMRGDGELTGNAAGAIADAATATFAGVRFDRPIIAGTLVGRTFAERTAGTAFGLADAAGDDEIYLTAFDVQDAAIKPEVVLIRHQTMIYEDKIPGWATMDAPTQAAIRSRYQCIVSVEAE